MKAIQIKSLSGIFLGVVFAAMFLPQPAFAIPTLQLDILGGVYDPVTETVITPSDSFTLYAYATPGNVSAEFILGEEYFLSAAITPAPDSGGADIGSFTLNGTTYLATQDLVYGTPPIDATANPYLAPHDIFPTFFLEVPFFFDPSNTATPYNTQDDPGMGPDTSGSGMFFMPFLLDVSGLTAGYELHFDLYSTKFKVNGNTTNKVVNNGDIIITVDDFAPFSHDAGTVPVPEPSTLILLGSGLLGLAYYRRRR